MHRFTLLLALALPGLPCFLAAQEASDSLPERVVARAYEALNRCDHSAYYALFASVWYHSVMEDSAKVATRQSRNEALQNVDPNSWWATCGDKPRKASPDRFKAIRRIVLGPYVVDQQSVMGGRIVHLDVFEVRNGKIVHEWESDDYSSWK